MSYKKVLLDFVYEMKAAKNKSLVELKDELELPRPSETTEVFYDLMSKHQLCLEKDLKSIDNLIDLIIG